MTTPDDKTLDMIVFNARQVAVAMSGEYAELAASADDYRTMADVITALRDTIASRERSLFVTEDTFEAVSAELDALRECIAALEQDNARLREHVANIHNRVRHDLYAEIEVAQTKAFKAMSGSEILNAAARAALKD